MRVVVCDIDGTLDLGGGYCRQELRQMLAEGQEGYPLIFVTFRFKERRVETEVWLGTQGLRVHKLVMRDDDDVPYLYREPWRYKAWALNWLTEQGYDVVAYFEDDIRSVEEARKRRIDTVFVGHEPLDAGRFMQNLCSQRQGQGKS